MLNVKIRPSETLIQRNVLRICCTLLALPIFPDIMDGFWCSRCLNDRIDLLYMIGSFASGANVSLVAKNGTKKIFSTTVNKIITCGRILEYRLSRQLQWHEMYYVTILINTTIKVFPLGMEIQWLYKQNLWLFCNIITT